VVRGAIIPTALAAVAILLAACGGPAEPAPEPKREVAATPGAAPVDGPTLRAVRARGRLNCGISQSQPGFATRDVRGWRGFDVDFCRAVAAAVFGDAGKVRLVPLDANDRFIALQSGDIDLIARGGLSFTRDAGRGADFVGVSFFDSQGFLVGKALAGRDPANLGGRTVCVTAASPAELNLAEFFETQKAKAKSAPAETEDAAVEAYVARRCEAITGDRASLAAIRSTLRNPADHVVLEGSIAKDPQGPFVRQGDSQWADIVRWTLNAVILAEELGISSKTVGDDRRTPKTPEIGRLLAGDGYGQMLLLRQDWAYQVIRQVGNYGEIFDRHLGPDTGLGLERGQNALWNSDPAGLIYSPPVR